MTTLTQAQPRPSSRRQLLFAVVLGVIAAVLVLVMLNSAGDDGGAAVGETSSVVVAAQTIRSGDKIVEGMVETKKLPASAIGAGTLTDKAAVVGQVARYPIEKGETLTTARLVDAPKVKAISFQIPQGLRGMTIPVSTTNTPAALIAPGDFVDVLVSIEAVSLTSRPITTQGGDKPKGAATIIQNVQVLSVERNYIDNGVFYEPSSRGQPSGEKDKVTFVMLAVTPDQAQMLWLAQDKGKLTLILRAFGDDTVTPLTPKLEPLTLP